MTLRCNVCDVAMAGDDTSHRHTDWAESNERRWADREADDQYNRPIVVEVPLDAHGPRCGHCGEYVDREGPTFCAVCEHPTIGRRTD